MKPILVVGVGNTLFGDDGVGCRLVEGLGRDAALRRRAEFVVGGSDVLRLADYFEGRDRVIIIDAMLSDEPPGTVSLHDEPFDELDMGCAHAHYPDLAQSVMLLKASSQTLGHTRFSILAIAVAGLESGVTLHAPALLPRIRGGLLAIMGGPDSPAGCTGVPFR